MIPVSVATFSWQTTKGERHFKELKLNDRGEEAVNLQWSTEEHCLLIIPACGWVATALQRSRYFQSFPPSFPFPLTFASEAKYVLGALLRWLWTDRRWIKAVWLNNSRAEQQSIFPQHAQKEVGSLLRAGWRGKQVAGRKKLKENRWREFFPSRLFHWLDYRKQLFSGVLLFGSYHGSTICPKIWKSGLSSHFKAWQFMGIWTRILWVMNDELNKARHLFVWYLNRTMVFFPQWWDLIEFTGKCAYDLFFHPMMFKEILFITVDINHLGW